MSLETLQALADPTRRRIVELLAEDDRSAGALAEHFEVSRPAVSRHLRVLREAGLVDVRPDAQQRIYRLRPEPFDEVVDWVRRLRGFWDARLDALDLEVRRE
ncbi:MAG TPA: metalloregulator ArsR/SmtB family transcription factor [Egicoccus sp.]|nr:metalloregulator ArsR/SmtB family transcription factor [Egicoccus sp.]HSK24374.1 metalloregulator ArsR/SmtB family transcription factor [Egicoccus sp.]